MQETASDFSSSPYFLCFRSSKRNKYSSKNNSPAYVPFRTRPFSSYIWLSFKIAVSSCCVARYQVKYIVYIGYVLHAGFRMVVLEAGCGALNTQMVFPSHGTHLVVVGRPSTPHICGGSQGCHVDPSRGENDSQTNRLEALGLAKRLRKPFLEGNAVCTLRKLQKKRSL